jgi:hypothetical protein
MGSVNRGGTGAIQILLLLSCLAAATALRASYLSSAALWVDEAESSLNALTILERGYPADRYLGLPIFENVLLTTSPHDPEYEFKDSSYSDRGVAIYHGWIPLYSIAAAEALAGIRPDIDDGRPPVVRHGLQELARRTIAPRVPSIIFAVVFLLSIYLLGQSISGGDTAWSVLIAAAFAQPTVWFGWQARYYSSTLAFTALSGLAIWKFTRRGTWRDSVFTGLALVLLFHTHSLSFLILTGVLLLNAPKALRRPGWVSKLLLTGCIVACGILPWMYWTNFLHAAERIPPAWRVLEFPGDFLGWFAQRKAFVVVIALTMTSMLLAAAFPRWRLGRRVLAATSDTSAFYFTVTWFITAYLAFVFLIPAASFVYDRLMLVVVVPGYLLFALSVASAARAITPRYALFVSPLIVAAFFGTRGTFSYQAAHLDASGLESIIEAASHWTLAPGTKLYAWPNQNLVFTYYSGLPVQSVAPVRKTFLDGYPGDVIFLETGTPYAKLSLSEVQDFARERGVELTADEARETSLRIQRHGARQYLQGRVAAAWPPPEPMRPVDMALLTKYVALTEETGNAAAEQYPILRWSPPSLLFTDMWLPVFYRFVDPEKRLGDQVNYRDRVRGATAIVLPNGSIIFDARRHRDVPLVDSAKYPALMRRAFLSAPDSASIEQHEERQ